MQEMLHYLIDNPYITVLIAVVIFILTLVFVVKRIFSFVMTLIFLVICIFSAYVIIYPETATKFLQGYTEEGRKDAYEDEDSSKSLNEQAKDVYDTAKGKLDEWSEKIQ